MSFWSQIKGVPLAEKLVSARQLWPRLPDRRQNDSKIPSNLDTCVACNYMYLVFNREYGVHGLRSRARRSTNAGSGLEFMIHFLLNPPCCVICRSIQFTVYFFHGKNINPLLIK